MESGYWGGWDLKNLRLFYSLWYWNSSFQENVQIVLIWFQKEAILSHNGGRRFCNTSSNLENQYVGDSFVAGFPIYVFLSVWMHIFSIFALQIICITCGKHSLLPFPWDNVEYLANKRRALTHSKPNAGCPNIEDRFTGLVPQIFYFAPKHSSWCETLVACQNCPKRVSTIWMSEWHCLFLICLPDLKHGC